MTQQYRTVVVAEDNPVVNHFLCELLKGEGYTVVSCVSGTDAQRIIMRIKPDLVITDMAMEVPDAGIRLLEHIRNDTTTANIHVIVCSANLIELERQQVFGTALKGHMLPKPYNPDYLLTLVRELLHLEAA